MAFNFRDGEAIHMLPQIKGMDNTARHAALPKSWNRHWN